MFKSQEMLVLITLRFLVIILIASISLSRSDSIITAVEEGAVQLEFPYPCDSNKVTIQSANRLPFYSSAKPESLNLPFYQLNRLSVTDKNCLVQVDINPVKRSDEATYICQAYRDGAIQSELTRIRLNVNYPPGNLYCTFSINDDADDAVGKWVPLQCEAPVGSLAGEIYCYQDSERVPSRSNLVETGETLKQTIWSRKEYPVFCCSAIFDRPKDVCECKDFVWDPMGNISQTNTTIDPCPATTPGRVVTLSQYPELEYEDNPQHPQLIASLKLTKTNEDISTTYNVAVIWGCVIVIGILVISQVTVILRLQVEKANTRLIAKLAGSLSQTIEQQDFASQTCEKELVLPTLSSSDKHRSKSLEFYWKEEVLTRKGLTESKSTSAVPLCWV